MRPAPSMPAVAVTKPDAGPPKQAKVLLEIEIVPKRAKATILFRGREYRQNTLEVLVFPSETPEVVHITAPGFQAFTQHITVNQKAKLKHKFKLKPVYRRVRPRPMDDELKVLPTD
jgi:hypothetical protein